MLQPRWWVDRCPRSTLLANSALFKSPEGMVEHQRFLMKDLYSDIYCRLDGWRLRYCLVPKWARNLRLNFVCEKRKQITRNAASMEKSSYLRDYNQTCERADGAPTSNQDWLRRRSSRSKSRASRCLMSLDMSQGTLIEGFLVGWRILG